ncbi:MAG: TrmO family methyltransferase [bacterium]
MSDRGNTQIQCDTCGRKCSGDEIRLIDGESVCLTCLYGDAEPITIRPIGVVRNDKNREEKGFGTSGGDISEIVLYPGMARFMKGLAEETHITVVWSLHQTRPLKTAFPRGWDKKHVGPFASRTPDRLTPVAVTDVELLEVKGTVLKVRGLDAINGTPVLDIKVAMESLHRSGKPETGSEN